MRYLIHLEEGDDEYFFSVGPLSWAYIHAPRPDFGAASSLIEIVPDAVAAELDAHLDEGAENHILSMNEERADDIHQCEVTVGSYENDRVLHLLFAYSCGQTQKRPVGQFADVYDGFIY
jgi:hypothetical protein